MSDLPACKYLSERSIPFEHREFSPQTEKGAANVAREFGFREGQMVKTLVFEVDTGEKVLIMVGGDQNAISGHLKKVIGSRNIRMAAADVVRETTGYEIGSIPPFSWQPTGFRSFLDDSLFRETVLGVGAGVWGNEILIAPKDLASASGAAIVNLTDRSRPALA